MLSSSPDFSGKSILLIDDVANSSRTMLYSPNPCSNIIRPRGTLVLVERTHKMFPIAVDYVGLSIAHRQDENIIVEWKTVK